MRPGKQNKAVALTIECCANSFGDIHYFYGPEDVKPRHHRFDKGSYVYLFENAHDRRCRVEIANHPGTEDQDAFDGCKSLRASFLSRRDCALTPASQQFLIRPVFDIHTSIPAWSR